MPNWHYWRWHLELTTLCVLFLELLLCFISVTLQDAEDEAAGRGSSSTTRKKRKNADGSAGGHGSAAEATLQVLAYIPPPHMQQCAHRPPLLLGCAMCRSRSLSLDTHHHHDRQLACYLAATCHAAWLPLAT